jgi:hypothetical protein
MHHRALAEAFSSAGADRLLLSAAPTIHFICDFFTTERGVFRFSFLPAFAGTGDGGTQPKKRYHYTVPEVSGKEKMFHVKQSAVISQKRFPAPEKIRYIFELTAKRK